MDGGSPGLRRRVYRNAQQICVLDTKALCASILSLDQQPHSREWGDFVGEGLGDVTLICHSQAAGTIM